MNKIEENEEEKKNIVQYMEQMNEQQKKAYLIALDHLKSSFSIIRSNGFKDFMKEKTCKK